MKSEITCSLVQDLLPGYIDGVIGEKSEQFIRQHVRECEDCRRVYDAMNTKSTPAELHAEELVRKMIRQKKHTRRNIVLALFSLALVAAVCLLPLPRSVHVRHEAMEWRIGDSEHSAVRTVVMEGVYFDFLFRNDFFDGSFIVSGYPETQRELLRCTFYDGMGTLYYSAEDGTLAGFGLILMQPDGSEFLVGIYEENGWYGGDGLMLTGPATNRENAVSRANALSQRYSPDFMGIKPFE